MKKTASKHTHHIKFNATEFFTKHIGVMGLVIVVMFFIIYFLSEKISSVEDKMIMMEANISEAAKSENNMSAPRE
jgi:predicted Holliday junction resolvase-like endonuclease